MSADETPDPRRLVEDLRYGVLCYSKRWSGDTFDDLGGEVNRLATESVMRQAADALERVCDERDAAETVCAYLGLALNSHAPLPPRDGIRQCACDVWDVKDAEALARWRALWPVVAAPTQTSEEPPTDEMQRRIYDALGIRPGIDPGPWTP